MTIEPASNGAWTPKFEFSDRIRKIRRDLGISQDEFARDLNVKKVTLGSWESGRTTPRELVAVAKRIELLTKVPATWTLGLETENRRPDGPDGGGTSRTYSNPKIAHRIAAPRLAVVSGAVAA